MLAKFVSNLLFCGIFALAAANHILHFEEELPKLVKAGIPEEYAPICLGFALTMMVLGTLLIMTVKFENLGLLQFHRFPSGLFVVRNSIHILYSDQSIAHCVPLFPGYICYVLFLVPVTWFMHAQPWIEAMNTPTEGSDQVIKIHSIQTLKNVSLIGACLKLTLASSRKSSGSRRSSKKSKKKKRN